MNSSIPRLEEDGKVLIEPVIQILALSDTPLRSSSPEGFLNFYEAFIRLAGNRAKWCRTNTQSKDTAFDERKREMAPFWFRDERSRQEASLGLRVHSGPSPRELLAPALDFYCDQAFPPRGDNYFNLMIPLGELTPAELLSLMQDCLRQFPLSWGYGGYGLLWNDLIAGFDQDHSGVFAGLLRRYPGIAHPDSYRVGMWATEGLVDVNWVTLLGNKLLEKAGGEKAVRRMLGPEINLLPLDTGNGIAVVAGDHPEAGDITTGNDLPLYRSVGRALRALRPEELNKTKFLPVPGLDKIQGEQWINRFFQ
jgi:hypothetical protein